ASFWLRVVADRPTLAPAWVGLGETALARQRFDEVESAAQALARLPGTTAEADVLRAVGLSARGRTEEARHTLGSAIARHPAAVAPRLILSRVLLVEGRDPHAAEQALRDVLRLDPANPEAQRNLEALWHNTTAGAAGRAKDILFTQGVV